MLLLPDDSGTSVEHSDLHLLIGDHLLLLLDFKDDVGQFFEGHLVQLGVHVRLDRFKRLVSTLGDRVVRTETLVEHAEGTPDPRRCC